MGYRCPICSDKLAEPPAEAGAELRISATPCGHVFHAYCIQKWLTGNLESSEQCPCCREAVPDLRCLTLFPTSYGDSGLDDSQDEGANHDEMITALRNEVSRLQAEMKEKDEMCERVAEEYRAASETWLEQVNSIRRKVEEWQAYGNRQNWKGTTGFLKLGTAFIFIVTLLILVLMTRIYSLIL